MIIRRIESKTAQHMKRVAAYARVSTDAEEQQESMKTQVDYYSRFIQQNPMWEFVKVYADTGKSATSADHRLGFQEMITDAKAGKLDIILVKSISRFSRNVADAQRYVHELKDHEVEVRFEREAISSFEPASDMIFSVLAAVAQEESRNISEHVKWSYRKNAEKGIRRLGNNRVLGYDEDSSGKLVPNKDAWIIRQIFTDYADGLPLTSIVERLNKSGAKRLNCDKPFCIASIQSILANELYVGDRLIQKRPPKNYLTKKPDVTQAYNSYYITDEHEAIIERETWHRAEARRSKTKDEISNGIHKRSTNHFLYGFVYCSDCKAVYTRRTVRGKNGMMQKVWKCSERVKGAKGNGCQNTIIAEDELLRQISEILGWPWSGADSFDTDSFVNQVQRVEIAADGVHVLIKAA